MFKAIRNTIMIGGILILLTAFVRVRYIQGANPQPDVIVQDSATIDRGDLALTVSASGPLQAESIVPLVFLGTGKVATVNVTEGQHVLKGQTLATLDISSEQTVLNGAVLALQNEQVGLQALTAAPRQADANAAQAAMAAAKAQLGAAQVGYDPIKVQLANLQIEISKNALWQAQLQRDESKQGNGTGALLSQLNGIVDKVPQPYQDQLHQALNAATGALGSLVTSPQVAESRIHSSEFEIQVSQAELKQAQTAHGDLSAIGAAQASIAQAQAALDTLLNGPDAQSIAIAQARVSAAQDALKLAQYNLSHATLTAPFDGVVTNLNLVAGQTAPLSQAALTLVDDSAFHVDVAVDEIDVIKLAVGQTVTMAVDALPGSPVTGTVDRIATAATNAGGVVTYAVRIKFDPTTQPLRVGMSSTASILVKQLNNVLRVRNRFVRLDRATQKASVIVQQPDGSFKEVPVTLGLRNDTYSEVLSGLSLNDRVVVLPRDTNLLKLRGS